MKKKTKLELQRERFGRYVDRFAIPTHRLDEMQARERVILAALHGYSMATVDLRKRDERRKQKTARGVDLCKKCSFAVNTYAHEEICGV